MAITPDTDILLIKCPLEQDNLNQLTFNNKTEQSTYFTNLPHKFVENCTYQRKDNIIRYPEHIDEIMNYNYVMYRNTNYGSKYFYAFITNMRYVNDGMTEITIKTDVYQTWQFDIQFKRSFIEREHTNNDTIGANTIPEGLEMGEYVATKADTNIFVFNEDNCVPVIGVTQLISPFTTYSVLNQIVPDGLYYIACKDNSVLKAIIDIYNSGYAESLSTVFMLPSEFFSDWTTIQINGVTYTNGVSTKYKSSFQDSYELTPSNKIDLDYTPKNKKLLTYPYRYLQASNNAGQVANYRYEDFKNPITGEKTNPYFQLLFSFGQGGNARITPINYKNLVNNDEESIVLGKLPIGSFNTDSYTNWLTQNALNHTLSPINALSDTILGTATSSNIGSVLGTANNGIRSIQGILQTYYQSQFIPNQVSGKINCGDVNYFKSLDCIKLTEFTIKEEYARIIDEYFNVYGYKTNRVKLPNLKTRQNWNYVKTIGANIEGNIPQNDIEELKSIFNSGVTLWHHPITYLDYSQTNSLV